MGKDVLNMVHEVCQTLMSVTGRYDIACLGTECQDMDAYVDIGNVRFACIVIQTISNANYASALTRMQAVMGRYDMPALLITGSMSPLMMQKFREQGVNTLDGAGNCSILHNDLYIYIIGQKNTISRVSKSKTINESTVRLLYYLLTDKALIAQPYRTMSEVSGLSLGSIKNAIDDLTSRKYVAESNSQRILINRDELIDLWQQRYNEVLKPKLLLKRMAFRTDEYRRAWKEIKLPKDMLWGGDCGANLADGYLIPGEYEIYSSVPAATLMTTGKVQMTEEGEISIYKLWWKNEEEARAHAPLLIVYADLMGSGDSRCIEAAQRIMPKL